MYRTCWRRSELDLRCLFADPSGAPMRDSKTTSIGEWRPRYRDCVWAAPRPFPRQTFLPQLTFAASLKAFAEFIFYFDTIEPRGPFPVKLACRGELLKFNFLNYNFELPLRQLQSNFCRNFNYSKLWPHVLYIY